MILNPTPIETNVFNGMWISQLRVIFPRVAQAEATPPVKAQEGFLRGQTLPYDGRHLLLVRQTPIQVTNLAEKRKTDSKLDSMLIALEGEIQRQSGRTDAVKLVDVLAGDPARPIMAMVIFEQGKPFRIADCYGLCATDPIFNGIFQNTMVEVARLGGLTVAA